MHGAGDRRNFELVQIAISRYVRPGAGRLVCLLAVFFAGVSFLLPIAARSANSPLETYSATLNDPSGAALPGATII